MPYGGRAGAANDQGGLGIGGGGNSTMGSAGFRSADTVAATSSAGSLGGFGNAASGKLGSSALNYPGGELLSRFVHFVVGGVSQVLGGVAGAAVTGGNPYGAAVGAEAAKHYGGQFADSMIANAFNGVSGRNPRIGVGNSRAALYLTGSTSTASTVGNAIAARSAPVGVQALPRPAAQSARAISAKKVTQKVTQTASAAIPVKSSSKSFLTLAGIGAAIEILKG